MGQASEGVAGPAVPALPELTATTAASEGAAENQSPAEYSSVIYIHGIGSQRRYEESSWLIDKIDKYLVQQYRRGNAIGMLMDVKVHVEPFRGKPDSDEIIAFINTCFSSKAEEEEDGDGDTKKDKRLVSDVRFYEVYWAPVLSEAKSALGVGMWVFGQAFRPWTTLRSCWRERQRLRRASLVSLFQRGKTRPPGAEQNDYIKLIEAYHDFERLSAHRKYPKGTFENFLSFISDTCKGKTNKSARLQNLARIWHRAYWAEEVLRAFTLMTIVLTLTLLAGVVLASVLGALQSLLGWAPLSTAVKSMDLPFRADLKTAAAIAGSLASLLGLSKFLTDYLGDVEVWSTYEETDAKHVARDKVLDQTIATFSHVLSDPKCERVTIVAHSLGTSIAHDALLALARRNRARQAADPIAGPVPLAKIEHFVTMGSPIDKIEYFFESYSSASHRYKRVIEALRGDLGAPPFSRNRKPHVHWINFWDLGDPISGALDSPASGRDFCQHVDNVHVASFGFPRPGASHAGYFDNETVISKLFQVIYQRGWSFRTLKPAGPEKPPDYDSVYQGPGEAVGDWRLAYLLTGAAIPWLTLLGLIAWVARQPVLPLAAWGAAIVAALVLLIGFLVSCVQGHRKPL